MATAHDEFDGVEQQLPLHLVRSTVRAGHAGAAPAEPVTIVCFATDRTLTVREPPERLLKRTGT